MALDACWLPVRWVPPQVGWGNLCVESRSTAKDTSESGAEDTLLSCTQSKGMCVLGRSKGRVETRMSETPHSLHMEASQHRGKQ